MSSMRILSVQGTSANAVRSISLQDLPPSAWNYIAGHPEESEDHSPQQLFGVVPWLYRGVHLRAQALSDIPWSLKKAGKEISSWDDYNPIPEAPWVGKLTSLLYRTEIAICLWGAAYWQRIGNKLGEVAPKADRTLAYRWLLPPTVEPLVDSETLSGVTGFRRTIKGQVKTLDVKDCVYFWLPSVTKEIGAGESPAHAALTAAGLIRNIDIFGDAFFHRGALAPTILTVQGDPPQEELDRLQRWWKRVAAGVRRAWETVAVRQTIDVKTLGAPPKELAMPELTASKQKDVAVALGVPFTLLFSEASNHATARSDEVGFYTRCVIPESQMVAEVLNDQIFNALGMTFEFHPERVDVIRQFHEGLGFQFLSLFMAKVITREEMRREMGLPEIPEGDTWAEGAAPVAASEAAGRETGGERLAASHGLQDKELVAGDEVEPATTGGAKPTANGAKPAANGARG